MLIIVVIPTSILSYVQLVSVMFIVIHIYIGGVSVYLENSEEIDSSRKHHPTFPGKAERPLTARTDAI